MKILTTVDHKSAIQKMILIGIISCYLLIALSACQSKVYQRTDYVFGTLVEITIDDSPDAEKAAQAIIDDLHYLESLLHAWKNSQLFELNAQIAARRTQIRISPELSQILRQAQKDALPIESWFNPAIGQLIALWGFHQDDGPALVPNQQDIKLILAANPRMSDLIIQDNTVFVNNSAISIDLGGYAKGFALDRAAAILKKRDIHNALINIGGNVLALGQKGDRHWVIGIRDPKANRAFATIPLYDGEAIGTSGDYQRFFIADNNRYHHIIDPKTGYPADQVSAVTIIVGKSPNAGRHSDMLSKPFFITGVNGFSSLCQQIPLSMIAFVDKQNNLYLSQKMKERMSLLETKMTVTLLPECVPFK
jgi:thiamine biosynthesis lipoprotein